MKRWPLALSLAGLLPALAPWGGAADSPKATPAPAGKASYAALVAPLVNKYCVRCHGPAKSKGGVRLDQDRDEASVLKHRTLWEKVADNLRSGDMPPPGAKRPSPAELDALNAWLDRVVLGVDPSGPRDPGRVTIRRLNRAEYNNTIRDLVGVDFKPARDFPADDVGYGFDNIGDVLSLPPLLMEKYLDAAEQVVEKAWADPKVRARLFPRPRKKPGDRRFVLDNLRNFATRAYRRPATEEEVKRLVRLVRQAAENGDGFETGVKNALTAVLVSPHFLFRIEADREPGNPRAVHPVTEWELASRLSYFLWSSMPDEELFRLARQKKLRAPGVLEAQVGRMLKDPRAKALADNFAGQWLQTRSLAELKPDSKQFPTFNDELRKDMQRETELFFLNVVREDRSILEFIDSDYTFVNERLAKHYGLRGAKGNEFRKVSLAGTPRGGVLTQASVLAVTSNPTRTSPVKRGKFILDNILGTPPPPPPPEAGELKEGPELKGTLRQRMEQHRANLSCATCHARMDPLGFGFENFDAVGTWRTHEGKLPIDPSGVLPGGQSFKGPAGLRAILKKKQGQFAKCLAEKLLTYALGRGMERSDRRFIEEIAREAGKSDYKFSSLVIEIVKSDPFQKRRGKGGKK